jgi:hypothetical protein
MQQSDLKLICEDTDSLQKSQLTMLIVVSVLSALYASFTSIFTKMFC